MSRHLQMLRDWHGAARYQMVDMVEMPAPSTYAGDDYTVVTIVEFVPKLPELMYAEVWLTDDDMLGLGIERYDRIANRIGVRTKATRFVAGFEPGQISFDRFASALKLVASGEIVIDCLYLPILGLNAVAKAPKRRLSELKWAGHGIPQLYCMKARPFPGFQRLRYVPWI